MFVSPRLMQLFLRILQARYWIVGVFALLTLAGLYGALRIPTDTSINRLIVASDPVAQATREFERVFPEGEDALIVLEAPDPLSLEVLQGVDQLRARTRPDSQSRGAQPSYTVFSSQSARRHRRRRCGEVASLCLGHSAGAPGRSDGRPLPRHWTRAQGEFTGRTRPGVGRNRRQGFGARSQRPSLHRGSTRRFAVARRLAGTPNRRVDEEIHAAVRHLPAHAGVHRLSIVACSRRHRTHPRRRGRDCSRFRAAIAVCPTAWCRPWCPSPSWSPPRPPWSTFIRDTWNRTAPRRSSIMLERLPINSCPAPRRCSPPRSALRHCRCPIFARCERWACGRLAD